MFAVKAGSRKSPAPATQDTVSTDTPKADRVPAADKDFAEKAAQEWNVVGSESWVALAQLKSSNEKVKDFGKRMVDDHSAANDKLKGAATQEGIGLPDAINARDQALFDRLSQLNGAAFDRAYAEAMVKDHQEDVAEFQKEANGGHNSGHSGTLARATAPTLQNHLKMARELLRDVSKGGSRTASASGY